MFSTAFPSRHLALAALGFFALFRTEAHADITFINGAQISLNAPALTKFTLDLNTLLVSKPAEPLIWSLQPGPQGSKPPTWLQIDNATSTLSGTPAAADGGVKQFFIGAKSAVDDGGRALITFTVFAVPSWSDNPLVIQAKEKTPFSLDLLTKATNPNKSGTLTFSLKDPSGKKPAWLIGPTAAGLLSGTPARADVGTTSGFQIVARTELGGEAPVDVQVVVAKTIVPPKFTNPTFSLDGAFEDLGYSQNIATDAFVANPEGTPLTFALKSGPASGWLKMSPQGVFSGTPIRSDKGAVAAVVGFTTTIDGQAYTDQATFNLEVKLVNKAPVWSRTAIDLPDAPVKIIYSQDISSFASDIDGDALTYKIESGPAWATIGEKTGILTGTPANVDIGTSEWVVSVSDGQLKANVTVHAKVFNTAPTWKQNPIVLPNAKEDSLFSQDISILAADVDRDVLQFVLVSGPAWLTVAKTGKVSGTPVRENLGLNTFSVSVSDGINPPVAAQVTIQVDRTNKPPVWKQNPIVLADAPERSPYTASIADQASDPDPGTLKITKVDGPAWLSISDTGALSGTPARADVGLDKFTVQVTDPEGLSAQSVVQIDVLKVNRAPVWSMNPIALPAGLEDSPYVYKIDNLVTDADGDALTFSKIDGPAWLSVSAAGALSGTPSSPDVGDFTATFQVDDGEAKVQVIANGKVNRKNYAPVLVQPIQLSVMERATATIALNDPKYVSDINGDALTFKLVTASSWASLSPQGSLVLKPLFANIGTQTLRIEVSDGTLATQGDVTIQVARDPRAPQWLQNPIAFSAMAREAFTASVATLAKDLDGLPIQFAKVSGPAWLTVDTKGNLSGTPQDADVGVGQFGLSVANDLMSANTVVNITVGFKNHPPALHAEALKFTVKERATFSENLDQDKYVTEIDTQDKLTFSLVTPPAWAKVTSAGALTLTPLFAQIGDQKLRLQVSDGTDTVQSDMLVTVVRDPRAPVWSENPVKFSTKARDPFAVSLAGKVRDLDGLPLNFAKKSGPDWLTVGADGKISGTPGDDLLGDSNFVITASNDVLSADAGLIVTVVVNNRAPGWTKNPIDLPAARASEAYTQSVAQFAMDPDPQDRLTFSKDSGPAWAKVAADGTISGTPLSADVGTTSLGIRVTDTGGLFAVATARIVVNQANTAPKWSRDPIPLTDATSGDAYTFDLKPFVSDADNGPMPLLISKVAGPAWLQVSPQGLITGTPAATDIGNFTAVFSATDGKLDSQVGAIGRVVRKNHAPVILPDALAFTIKERQTLQVDLTQPIYVRDEDGDALKFKLVDTKEWLQLSEIGALLAKPMFKDIGVYTIRFQVTDGTATAAGAMQITVVRDPRAPQWIENPIRMTAKAGVPFVSTLQGKAKDLDGIKLVFSKTSGPDWLSVADDGSLTGTPLETNVGDGTFAVAVKNDLLSAPASLIVTVSSANSAPVWSMNPVKLPNGKVSKSYSESIASFVRDPDGDAITFAKVSGPSWGFVTNAGIIIGIPLDADEGPNAFIVRAKDSKGAFADAEVQVLVESGTNAPKWTQDPIPLGDISAEQVYGFDLSKLATDADGDALTFRKIAGPAWLNLSAIGALSGVPRLTDVGEFTAVFEVSDGRYSAQVGAFGKVTVPNAPPVIHADALKFVVQEDQIFDANLSDKKYVEDTDQPLAFTLVAPEAWTTLSPVGALHLTPKRPEVGDHQFNFEVKDAKGASSKGVIFVTVTPKKNIPEWLENPLRFTATEGQPFGVSIANKVRDPLGGNVKITKKSGPDWLVVYLNGGLSGVPRTADIGENAFVVTATNSDGSADVNVLITVKKGAPQIDSWAIDEAVPGAPVENLWVIDNSWRWRTPNWLIQGLKENIGLYYRALDQARVAHTGVYLSSDVARYRGLPVRDPSNGTVLLTPDDPMLASSFNRRVNASQGGQCETSPMWSMFRFYEQLPGLTTISADEYMKPEVPTETLIVTRQADMYRSYIANKPQASWTAWEFADSYVNAHKQKQKALRISAVAPGCTQLMDPQDPTEPEERPRNLSAQEVEKIQTVSENPYRILTKKTGGTYYTFDCSVDMRKVMQDFADKTIFNAYVHAKKRVKLSKTPTDVASIRVTLAGVTLPGNTSAATDKWYYDATTNEVVIRWDRIDTSALKPGDRIEIHYQG